MSEMLMMERKMMDGRNKARKRIKITSGWRWARSRSIAKGFNVHTILLYKGQLGRKCLLKPSINVLGIYSKAKFQFWLYPYTKVWYKQT